MGKKSKANRKKPPVTTAAVATGTATAVVVTSAAATTATKTKRGEFPESIFYTKGGSFRKKGNHAKSQKMYVQGIEHGCVRCMHEYNMTILYNGARVENMAAGEFNKDNNNLHLALPLSLEGAIRGNHDSMMTITAVYIERGSKNVGHSAPATPHALYWTKHASKTDDRGDVGIGTQMKQAHEVLKEHLGTQCSVCGKHDSETVTLLKCEGCHFYFYCSKACQQKMWVEGQHAGVCRQLGILQKYHKPFAKKIWEDIAVHGIPPQDVPELQELRQRLGLSRPQADYQELLDAAKTGRLKSAQLILPRKDGTVQIGSFPRPI